MCWHKGLLPKKPNSPPMDYETLQKKEEPGPITVGHMTKHMVDYIRFDQLGVIDNAHKVLADKKANGVESDICLQLAEIHSLAVDAPKTGKWPEMPSDLFIRDYPDFMMKSDKPVYQSERVLGDLYRKCRSFKENITEPTSRGIHRKLHVDEVLLVHGHEVYLERARETYSEYREQLETLMNLYGVESEAELMTGSFLKLRNRLGKEKTEIANTLSQIVSQIRSNYRTRFFKEFGLDAAQRRQEEVRSLEMQRKASAWYFVAYTHGPELGSGSAQDRCLLGFPWLVDDVMLGIIRSQRTNQCPQRAPSSISASVSQSLATLYSEEKESLLDEYKLRIRAKEQFSRKFGGLFSPHVTVTAVGSSATLLSREDSPLHLCAVPLAALEAGKELDKEQQISFLENVETALEELYHSRRLLYQTRSPVMCLSTNPLSLSVCLMSI